MEITQTTVYTYATGGVTKESLVAWNAFRETVHPKDGWQADSIFCTPAYPIALGNRTSNEAVIMLNFHNKEGFQVSFLTDGFLWGYSGEGPVGFAQVLGDVLHTFGLTEIIMDPDRKLLRFIAQQSMDSAWSENLSHLAALVYGR